jgi:hypothetical protein
MNTRQTLLWDALPPIQRREAMMFLSQSAA